MSGHVPSAIIATLRKCQFICVSVAKSRIPNNINPLCLILVETSARKRERPLVSILVFQNAIRDLAHLVTFSKKIKVVTVARRNYK